MLKLMWQNFDLCNKMYIQVNEILWVNFEVTFKRYILWNR